MVEDDARIELTLQLWGTGDSSALEDYVDHLDSLLPRHQGRFERRVAEVGSGPGRPDAVIVLSFPNGVSVDGFLRDPLRGDAEDLAGRAVARALITDARHHGPPGSDPASGSVSPKHPMYSPLASLGRYFCFCSSEP